jgi:ankyrin repeat protein
MTVFSPPPLIVRFYDQLESPPTIMRPIPTHAVRIDPTRFLFSPAKAILEPRYEFEASIGTSSDSPLLRLVEEIRKSSASSLHRPIALRPTEVLALQKTFSNSALVQALETYDLDAAFAALELGANPHLRGSKGTTIGHVIAAKGTASQLNEALKRGLNPNAQDRWGRTALHIAAARGDIPLCESLVGAGADSSMQDSKSNSPYLQALLHQQYDAALWLATHTQPDYTSLNRNGMSALHYLARPEAPVELLRIAIRARGINLNVEDSAHFKPIEISIMHGLYEKTELFILAGANIEFENQRKTPEIIAIQYGFSSIAELIRSHSTARQNRMTDQIIASKKLAARLAWQTKHTIAGLSLTLGSLHHNQAWQVIAHSFAEFCKTDTLLSPPQEGLDLVLRAYERFPFTHTMSAEEIKELIDRGEMVILYGGSPAHMVPYLLYDHHLIAVNSGDGAKMCSEDEVQPFQVKIGEITIEEIQRIKESSLLPKSGPEISEETAAITSGGKTSCLETIRATPQISINCCYEGLSLCLIPAVMFAKAIGRPKEARSALLPSAVHTFQRWLKFERNQALLDYLNTSPEPDMKFYKRAWKHAITLSRPAQRVRIAKKHLPKHVLKANFC